MMVEIIGGLIEPWHVPISEDSHRNRKDRAAVEIDPHLRIGKPWKNHVHNVVFGWNHLGPSVFLPTGASTVGAWEESQSSSKAPSS